MLTDMKLIFGLGNPGNNYTDTRHNVGFVAVGAFVKLHGGSFSEKSKLKAHIAEVSVDGEKILLAKPDTFYNLVGESYRAIIDFYKIEPRDTLVIHDELALPFGTVRVREGGSDAGNNGIKSVNQHGGETSMRIRVGIANEDRQLIGDVDFVLGRLKSEESKKLESHILSTVTTLMDDFAADKLTVTSHRHE